MNQSEMTDIGCPSFQEQAEAVPFLTKYNLTENDREPVLKMILLSSKPEVGEIVHTEVIELNTLSLHSAPHLP